MKYLREKEAVILSTPMNLKKILALRMTAFAFW
jgi:hypothetical protein